MPRPPRISIPGAFYHVTARGNNRNLIFFDDADRQEYLRRLAEYKSQLGFEVFCYCLMSNHVHLGVHLTGTSNLSRMMQLFQAAYVQYVNHRRGRVGHLFQGRFFSRIIQDDRYLLAVSRYVHLNPVKAGLVGRPQLFPWSSCRAYFDAAANHFRLVNPRPVLQLLGGRDILQQRRRYAELLEDGNSASGLPEVIEVAPRGRPKKPASRGVCFAPSSPGILNIT
jgi:REP element-mobilizing transposase RayT